MQHDRLSLSSRKQLAARTAVGQLDLMSSALFVRLRWHGLRAISACVLGFASAIAALIASNYQYDLRLQSFVILSPLLTPLVVLAWLVRRDRRRAIFDRVLGVVVFLGFALAGEMLLPTLILQSKRDAMPTSSLHWEGPMLSGSTGVST